MNGQEFHDSVFGLRRKHLAKLVSAEIKDFFPTKKSYKLKGFLSSLYFKCEHFETNFDKDELYTSIGNGFLKFQKILNEELDNFSLFIQRITIFHFFKDSLNYIFHFKST